MDDELRRLRDALKYYANPHTYQAPLINDPYSGMVVGPVPVLEDRGAVAREALVTKP